MRGAQKGQSHYAAAKAGVMALTRCAAVEAAESGVRVNAVAPSLAMHAFLHKVTSEEVLAVATEDSGVGIALVRQAEDRFGIHIGRVVEEDRIGRIGHVKSDETQIPVRHDGSRGAVDDREAQAVGLVRLANFGDAAELGEDEAADRIVLVVLRESEVELFVFGLVIVFGTPEASSRPESSIAGWSQNPATRG